MNSSSVTNMPDALSQLPSSDIAKPDKVFPARDVINSLVHDIKYILDNTSINQNITIDDTEDWNALYPSVFTFDELGLNAPDSSKLDGQTSGVVFTSSNFQFVITSGGCAYRLNQGDWIYLGQGVPGNIDVNHLIDLNYLNRYMNDHLTDYVTTDILKQEASDVNSSISSNTSTISSKTNSLNNSIYNTRSQASYSNSSLSSLVSSVQSSLYNDFNFISNNSSVATSNSDEIKLIASSLWGSGASESYSGVYGINGLASSVSVNSSEISSQSASTNQQINSLATTDSALGSDDSTRTSLISQNTSNISNLYQSVSNNANDTRMSLSDNDTWVGTGNLDLAHNGVDPADMHPKIKDYLSSLVPYVYEAYMENNSIANTSYVSGYSQSNVFSMASASASNLGLIKGNLYVKGGLEYDLTADIQYQTDNGADVDNYTKLLPVEGTLGLTEQDQYGDSVYQTAFQGNNDYTNNGGLVKILYPLANDDVNKQYTGDYVDIKFKPKTDEKLGIVSIPFDPRLKPPVFTNIRLDVNNPIGNVMPTTSLLADDTNTISNLESEYSQNSNDNQESIILNNEYTTTVSESASSAMDYAKSVYNHASEVANSLGASYSSSNVVLMDSEGHSYVSSVSVPNRWPIKEFDSNETGILPVGVGSEYANAYNISQEASSLSSLNAQPAISFAPTASFADSCSQDNDHYVYIYPDYDNDKEEQAIDWCFENITPDVLKNVSNPAPTMDTVKKLTAGIIANIITIEFTNGEAIADPQDQSKVADWRDTNYLGWQYGGYSTNDILSYLDSTLLQSHAGEWQNWNTYLKINESASMCAQELSNLLGNGADTGDCSANADQVYELLY